MSEFTYAELFAGIGGLGRGFAAVGGTCVYANEYDRNAADTYELNLPEVQVDRRDIREVDSGDVPEHDILLGGFPCQPFSQAGQAYRAIRGVPSGFDDPKQGNMFFQLCRILAAHKPRAFVLENVLNIVRHDNGRTWETIGRCLFGLGYAVESVEVNAAAWVPQNRKRIFIVGLLEGSFWGLPEVELPLLPWPTLADILHECGDVSMEDAHTLTDGEWAFLCKHKHTQAQKGNGFGYRLFGPNDVASTLTARYGKDGSEILIKQKDDRPRMLSTRECARLMGFDPTREHTFKLLGNKAADYKQFGNAVVPQAAQAVADVVIKDLERS